MSNKYVKSEIPFPEYRQKDDGYAYPKFPLGKMLSIGATAYACIVPNCFQSSVNDAAAIEESVEIVERYESTLVENIQKFNKVISVLDISKGSIIRQELLEQIMSFKSLINNWDGFGALPASAKCAASTIRIIEGLSDHAIKELDDLFPNTNGSISLKWVNSLGERLSLSVGSESFSYYCAKRGGHTDFNDDVQITAQSILILDAAILSIMIANV